MHSKAYHHTIYPSKTLPSSYYQQKGGSTIKEISILSTQTRTHLSLYKNANPSSSPYFPPMTFFHRAYLSKSFFFSKTKNVINMEKEILKKDEESSKKYNKLIKNYLWILPFRCILPAPLTKNGLVEWRETSNTQASPPLVCATPLSTFLI